MVSFLTFLFILGLLIIVHEFGHFFAARRVGVRVEKFSLGFGPQLVKKKKNHTEYSVSAIPLGGYVKLAGDNLEECKGVKYEYFSKSPEKRFLIIFFGPLLNYLLGFVLFWGIFVIGYPGPRVAGVLDGFGAKEAGIEVGDTILFVDGKKIYFWEQLQNAVFNKKAGDKVNVSFSRRGQKHIAEVKIKEQQLKGPQGKKVSLSLIGVVPEKKHGPLESLWLSARKTQGLTIMTYDAIWGMITGKKSLREVTGPVGVLDLTSKIAPLGLVEILNFIGLLSISLALFNLLPLPVLDGGHILFLGFEKIRGKALSIKTDRIVNQIGMTLIIFIALLVTYNDILRLFGDKIAKIFAK